AWNILRETTNILLEAVPKDIAVEKLVSDVKNIEGVKDVHDLHIWSITRGVNALSCHVMIDNLPPSASASILQSITAVLSDRYNIGHTTIQFECHSHKNMCCEVDGLYCRLGSGEASCCDHD
ncbi:MAG TPA: cation transporter, partial [Ktedonobacteraceae bacterium]